MRDNVAGACFRPSHKPGSDGRLQFRHQTSKSSARMPDFEKESPESSSHRGRTDESVESIDTENVAKEVDIEPEADAISVAHSKTTTISGHDEGKTTAKPENRATLTRTTSVIPEAVIVDRKNRRGLFGRFTLIPEVENSCHYARKTKWFITAIVAGCAMGAPMGSAIVMPALQDIAVGFGSSSTVANMSVAVYMLSMAIFPLWWSSFSETVGRRTIYIISFTFFTIFAILSAVSTNMAMFIVMRTFSGGAAASVQAVGAGSVADIWETKERGKAMGMFYLGPLCGPLFAPIIGGVLAQTLGWRSTQWFLAIYGAVTLIIIIFAMPETLRKQSPSSAPAQHPSVDTTVARPDLVRVSTRQSVQVATRTTLKTLRRYFIDPLVVITWLRCTYAPKYEAGMSL